MRPELTADALVQLVHRYYPVGIHTAEPGYNDTEEVQRLTRLLEANAAGSQLWRDFYQRVRKEFPDSSLWDTTVPLSAPCFGCRVSQPGFEPGDSYYDSVVCLVSQLAPVYALYASELEQVGPSERRGWFGFPPFPSKYQSREANLARLIESTFGYTRLPNEVLSTPVPDLVPRTANFSLGEAQLIDCLFTPNRW